MPPIPDEQTAPGPSIREALEAAAAGGGADEGAQQNASSAPASPIGEQKQGSSDDDALAAAAARARDEQGRFAPAEKPTDTAASETASTAAPEPQATETIRPPASLPAALKAEFATLPPAWQKAIADQEKSVSTAKAEWGEKGQRLNRLDEILAPRKDQLALAGKSDVQYVQELVAADVWLSKDPLAALDYLARSYGVNLQQIAQATGARQGQPQQGPQVDPTLAPLFQQVQTLTQTVAQQQQSAEAARLAEASSEIEQFAADPKNLYFHNVATEMGRLMESGRAKTLSEAYETACWADKDIRPLLIAQQAPKPDAQQQARAKAAAAGQASGSVVGAPGNASPGALSGSKGSIRADLEYAASLQGARVG